MTSCNLRGGHGYFGGTSFFHLQVERWKQCFQRSQPLTWSNIRSHYCLYYRRCNNLNHLKPDLYFKLALDLFLLVCSCLTLLSVTHYVPLSCHCSSLIPWRWRPYSAPKVRYPSAPCYDPQDHNPATCLTLLNTNQYPVLLILQLSWSWCWIYRLLCHNMNLTLSLLPHWAYVVRYS